MEHHHSLSHRPPTPPHDQYSPGIAGTMTGSRPSPRYSEHESYDIQYVSTSSRKQSPPSISPRSFSEYSPPLPSKVSPSGSYFQQPVSRPAQNGWAIQPGAMQFATSRTQRHHSYEAYEYPPPHEARKLSISPPYGPVRSESQGPRSPQHTLAYPHLVRSPYSVPELPDLHPAGEPMAEVQRRESAPHSAEFSNRTPNQVSRDYGRAADSNENGRYLTAGGDAQSSDWATNGTGASATSPSFHTGQYDADKTAPTRRGAEASHLAENGQSRRPPNSGSNESAVETKKLSRELPKRWKARLKDMFKKEDEPDENCRTVRTQHWTDEDY